MRERSHIAYKKCLRFLLGHKNKNLDLPPFEGTFPLWLKNNNPNFEIIIHYPALLVYS